MQANTQIARCYIDPYIEFVKLPELFYKLVADNTHFPAGKIILAVSLLFII